MVLTEFDNCWSIKAAWIISSEVPEICWQFGITLLETRTITCRHVPHANIVLWSFWGHKQLFTYNGSKIGSKVHIKSIFIRSSFTLGWTPVWTTKQMTGKAQRFIEQNPSQLGKQIPSSRQRNHTIIIKYKEQNWGDEARCFHKRLSGRREEAILKRQGEKWGHWDRERKDKHLQNRQNDKGLSRRSTPLVQHFTGDSELSWRFLIILLWVVRGEEGVTLPKQTIHLPCHVT